MAIFLTWFIVALLGIFLVLSYLRIRTSLLTKYGKDDVYFFGVLLSIFWPVALPVLFLVYPCMHACVWAVTEVEKAMEKKPEILPVEPPASVNAARSGYRNVEYDDGYNHHREY